MEALRTYVVFVSPPLLNYLLCVAFSFWLLELHVPVITKRAKITSFQVVPPVHIHTKCVTRSLLTGKVCMWDLD